MSQQTSRTKKEKQNGASGGARVERSPVIVVMGHIDHGKSTLLDFIRKSNVVEEEAGGITQHISAYEVVHEREGKNKKITFIDTPGHAAFSAMRSQGAHVADIAIIVVAADDGVMEQTVEAYKAVKDAEIPAIVAINKIDKPEADVNKTITSLIEHEIYLEGYGGDIPYTAISAKEGENVDELLDVILLVAELEELTGDPSAPASGIVIETNVSPKKGTSATLIIKDGALKKGMYVRAGSSLSPVRMMEDFHGNAVEEATFSSPVRITGFNTPPDVGGVFESYKTRNEAREDAARASEQKSSSPEPHSYADDVFVLPVVIKTDARGIIAAAKNEIKKLERDDVKIKFISEGIGSITENDIRTAAASENGIVVGFNVEQEETSRHVSKQLGVEVGTFSIIYGISDWLEGLIERKRPKKVVKKVIGSAKVLKTFSRSGKRQVIGGKVNEGKLEKGAEVIIKRRDEEIDTGTILELQQQKAGVSEVKEGSEFGANIETAFEIARGDVIEAYTHVEV